MEKNDDATDVIKLKKWDGNPENFAEWLDQFTDHLILKDLDETLEKEFKDQLPARENAAGTEDEKKAVRKNKKAYASAKLAITSLGLRAKMENLKTAEWPTPPMWKVMEFLRNECRPKDMISKAQQKGKLMQLRPCEGEDPDKYLTAVIKIEMEHGVKFEEEDKIAQAMIALGPEYGDKLNDATKTLKEKGEDVTFAALMERAKEK